jgi:uncharacterized coiled-coil protein SlyX
MLRSKLEEKRAADLIDENVSFDFKKFLKNVGPAPSFSEPVGPTPKCLSVDTIWAFHRRDLDPAARAKVEEHVGGCDVCREVLTSYVDAQPEEMPDRLFERITGRMRRLAAAREKVHEADFAWPALATFARWAAVPAMAVLLAWVIYPARPYLGYGVRTTEDAATIQRDIAELKNKAAESERANKDLQTQLANYQRTDNELQGDLRVVTDKLKITQGQLKKARQESAAQDTETEEKLNALDTSVHSELATKASSADVKSVDTAVSGVRTDLETTKGDLRMTRSEMGTLIARNHEEIDELRRLGERDYIEFTITDKNRPQKVGDVTVELKGVNEKRNQFSLALVVEDKRVEKKNLAVNEPIFFYTSGARIPQEIVVNTVGEHSVSGYLSIPKVSNPMN